jgi:hypothetical protein
VRTPEARRIVGQGLITLEATNPRPRSPAPHKTSRWRKPAVPVGATTRRLRHRRAAWGSKPSMQTRSREDNAEITERIPGSPPNRGGFNLPLPRFQRGRWPSPRGRRGSFVRRLVTNQNNRPSVGPPPAALDSRHLPRQGGGAEGFCVTSHSRTEGAMVAALKSHGRTACGSCGDVPPNPRPGPVFARAKPTHARDVKIKTRGEAPDARDETSKPRGEVVKPGDEKTNARANIVSTRGEKINARGIVFSPRAITTSPRAIIVSTRGITVSPRAITASARPDHTSARISAATTPARTPHDRPIFDADRGMIAQASPAHPQTTQIRAPPRTRHAPAFRGVMDAHGHKHGTRPLTHFRVGVWGGQQNTDPKFGRVACESVPPPAVVGAWCGDTRRAADRGSSRRAGQCCVSGITRCFHGHPAAKSAR